jgi:hypothetical protein
MCTIALAGGNIDDDSWEPENDTHCGRLITSHRSMGKKREFAKALGPAVKPVAKAIVKAGLSFYEAAEGHAVDMRDGLKNLIAEVRKEMNGTVKAKDNSKKSTRRRRKK